ncbi:MAG TPA: cupin domain-containing protein [Gemmatimonadales bacterium]|nr:cupin domain-containing protein [Gemmatimonadales bacterium]
MRIRMLLALLLLVPVLLAAGDPAAVRLVLTQRLPLLRGDRLQVQVVEVTYPPGGESEPHSHPCAVVGYVADGAFHSQVDGGPDTVYRAGQSFYEAPNAVHRISANASADRPVRFTATFVCDSTAALTVPAGR